MSKILQIIPAPEGLFARSGAYGKIEESFLSPVMCLALVEDDDGSRYVGAVDFADCDWQLVQDDSAFRDFEWHKEIPKPHGGGWKNEGEQK